MDKNVIIYKNVIIGLNPQISPFTILGKPPLGKSEGELELFIGDNATIRSFTTIYAGNIIGCRFSTGQNVSIRENNKLAIMSVSGPPPYLNSRILSGIIPEYIPGASWK